MRSVKKYQEGGAAAAAIGTSSMSADLAAAQKASTISAGIGGIADIGVGAYNIIEGVRQSKQAKAEIERLKKSAPVLTTPSQYYEAQKMAYDQRLIDLQKETVARNVSQSLQTAGQLGGRALLGSVGALQSGADRAMQEISLDAANKRMAATTQLGAARERETAARETRYQGDLGFERQKYADARAAVGEGIGQVVSGAANTAAMFIKDGGVIKTPGKFSHEKNPIDIVKGGAKIGEMTGGEYIFNPKQMGKIKDFVSNGDKDKLHSYVKSLIKKFNSK